MFEVIEYNHRLKTERVIEGHENETDALQSIIEHTQGLPLDCVEYIAYNYKRSN
jgi:hypothetical protein